MEHNYGYQGMNSNLSYLTSILANLSFSYDRPGSRMFNMSDQSSNAYLEILRNRYNNKEEETLTDKDDHACFAIQIEDFQGMMSHKVYLFSSLMFVLLGLIGNGLSIMVFSSKVMRVVSSNVYLLFLAISDSLYLISVFFTKVLTTLRCLYFVDSHMDSVNRNTVLCKLLQYMQDLFADYSTCLILAFTVERLIACYYAIKFKEICTLRRARITCASMFAVTSIVIAPYHIMFIGRPEGYNVCSVLPHKEAEFTILYIIEIMLFRVLPVFVIAILNVFITVKVTKMSREKIRRTSTRLQSFHGSQRRRSIKEDKHRQLTIMLILVSSSYIIAYLPVLVHFVLWKLKRSALITVTQRAMDIFMNYARPMYIFGFAINFFLYTMSGRVFRDQLILMLFGKTKITRCNTERNTENTGLQQPLTVAVNGKHETDAKIDDEKQALATTQV